MKNTSRRLISISLFSFLCLIGFQSAAQYSALEWSLYFYEKNVKMVDSELVENVMVTLENNKEYVYMVGQTYSTTASQSFCNTTLGNTDAFLAKFDSKGKVIWIRYLGGSGTASDTLVKAHDDWGYALAFDKAPNGKPRIYVGGTTARNNAVMNCSASTCAEEAYQSKPADGWDGFVAKYDGNGNLLRWTYLGGGEAGRTDTDEVLSLAVYNHQVFVTGYAEGNHSSMLQHGKVKAAYDSTYNKGGDAFIAVFDTCLSSLNFFSYYNVSAALNDTLLDPSGQDRIHGIKIGHDGSIYVNGTTSSDAGIATHPENVRGGNLDEFAGKWITDGQHGYRPEWSLYQGGSGRERGRMLTLDEDDNVFVTGITYSDSTTFPAIGNALQKNNGGDPDAFISKIDANGNIKWRTYFGGTGQDISNGIQCRRSADGLHQYIAIAGLTKNCDLFTARNFPPAPGNTLNGKAPGNCNPFDTADIKNDAFVLLVSDPDFGVDTAMNIYFGSYLGGSKGETYGPSTEFTGYGPSVSFAKSGNMYVAFSSASKDIGDINHGNAGKIKSKFHGEFDAVLQKFPPTPSIKQSRPSEAAGDQSSVSLFAYPVPFTENVTIRITANEELDGQLKLFTLSGQLVKNFGPFDKGTTNFQFDGSAFPGGVYILQYISSNGVHVIKLIKE